MYSNTPVEITTGYFCSQKPHKEQQNQNSALCYRSSMDKSCVLIKATCFQTIQDEPHGKSRALTQTEQVLEVFECLHVCSDLQNATIRGEQITNTTKAMMRDALFICTRIVCITLLLSVYYIGYAIVHAPFHLFIQFNDIYPHLKHSLLVFFLGKLWIKKSELIISLNLYVYLSISISTIIVSVCFTPEECWACIQ